MLGEVTRWEVDSAQRTGDFGGEIVMSVCVFCGEFVIYLWDKTNNYET